MDIIREIVDDCEKGASHLLDEYGGRLKAAALALCNNETDAKDLVSETVDIAVRTIGSYRNEAVLFEWLFGIMKNLYRHSRRRMSATNEIAVPNLPEVSAVKPDEGELQVLQAVDAGILRDAVNALPPDMREAVVLRYFMDMPLVQIAKFLSLPVGTVKSRLHYARIALAARLGAKLKKPAVALIALGLFLAASAAVVAVSVRGGSEVAASETAETAGTDETAETAGAAGTSGTAGTTGMLEKGDSAPAASEVPVGSDYHLQSVNNQGDTEMNIKAKAMTALAAATLAATPAARAKTVAWYHFNEGASGETAAGGQPVVLNAVDPDSLAGTPYALTGTRAKSETGNLPAYTNDMPSCVSWFDPVTGARGGDNRSIFLKTNDRKSSYPASTILIDDDAQFHCQRITVELMLKSSPEAAAKHAYADWLHVLNMLSSGSGNNKSWGIMIRGSGQMIGIINTAENDFNGSSTSGDAGGGGAAGYLYSAVVSGNVPKITDGKWHHVAMTYDGAMVRLYVDYALRGYLAWSGTLAYDSGNAGKLCIGGNYGTSYGAWDGFIDEVRISDEALPPEKFLQIGGLNNHASDPDTAIYLPFNALDFSADKFFGTVGQAVFHNSACSTNAALINLSLSTIGAGVYPRLDTGASAVVSNEIHAGIFAANTIDNTGCWTYTNNPAYPEKARHVLIDDYSKNNNEHLISAGDFTAEFYLKVPATPTSTSYILVENSGAKGSGTIQIYMSSSWLYCRLASQDALNKYENGETSEIATWNDAYVPIADIVGGTWHHVALVVDRTRQTAAFYVDGRVVREHKNFVLASSVSTKDGYATLKIGDGWGGNNVSALHGLSIDEFRITRRALAPQEFLMAGAAPASGALDPTRAWIGFEGDLSVKPDEGAIPEGSSSATTVTMEYTSLVPGIRLIDGNGNLIRASNASSLRFSGAYGSGEASPDTASQRLFFSRNILLERDMKSMTVEFFMKGTKNEAKAWSTILRMYGNATGSDSSPFRRLWSVGYSNTAGNLYVIKDVNGTSQSTFYPDNTVSLADGKWHHIAVTFAPDGNGNTLCNVYKDHQPFGSQHTFNGEMECGDYDTSSFAVGSRYNGYLDEIRVSKGVLTVDQMLHAQPRGTALHLR